MAELFVLKNRTARWMNDYMTGEWHRESEGFGASTSHLLSQFHN